MASRRVHYGAAFKRKVKDSITEALKKGANAQRKRVKQATYDDVDQAFFSWFRDTRARNIPVSGAILQQKAKDFACLLDCNEFKASCGWLHQIKAWHAIVRKVASSESSSADAPEGAAWIEKELPEIMMRYQTTDICNIDESRFLYQMLPNRTLALKGDSCHSGKQSKLRLTVVLCVNMDATDKRVPLVIGRSKKPHCCKGSRRLDVEYTSNLKA
ncbi:tigger transposable element-derived protein 6-like [Ornithodoros turicata]|uniref:tigger transposable element-derived protein 6-like n=1 Tax=Ornithodoros turicata TaxID=34597 RepID=UPI0031386520